MTNQPPIADKKNATGLGIFDKLQKSSFERTGIVDATEAERETATANRIEAILKANEQQSRFAAQLTKERNQSKDTTPTQSR